MGYGTGIHNVVFFVMLLRGITIGVVGAGSLDLALALGVPQNCLIAARGVGHVLSPALLSGLIGRVVWTGNSQLFLAVSLLLMAFSEVAMKANTSGAFGYVVFFLLGLATAMIDSTGDVVMMTAHREKCAMPLNMLHALSGLGGMIAPYLFVAFPDRILTILAAAHVLLALGVAGRRAQVGKPQGWQAKIQAVSVQTTSTTLTPTGIPTRILRGGMAFIFFSAAAETAMASWGFTFAITELQQPPSVAARFPATFYFFFTFSRILLLFASKRPPSLMMRLGALLMLVGAACLRAASYVRETRGPDAAPTGVFLACVALIGVGTCPQMGSVLATLRQHGALTSRQQGQYRTAAALGNTMGMWLPGVIGLPTSEAFWAAAAVSIVTAMARDFPMGSPKLEEAQGVRKLPSL